MTSHVIWVDSPEKKCWARGLCPRHEENEHSSCFLCCSVVGCQDKYPGINQEHEGNMSRCRIAKIRNLSDETDLMLFPRK